MRFRSLFAPVAAALVAATVLAVAQSRTVGTVFFTGKGDITFPFVAPLADGTPGVITNMTLGSSTSGGVGYFSAINGINAGTASSLVITGGTSSTSASAGAAARLHGGVPGATGIGGDATVRGGAGGSTSGAGGLASITGGAGTAGNATGGLSRVVGGAGQGSAAGGAALLTGGAGGLTGAGGAITINGGAGGATSGVGGAVTVTAGASTTSGAGSGVTITAAAGVGSTNAGGAVNLVPGAAASTGIPGTVQINGNAALVCATYQSDPTPTATDKVFFIATRPYIVVTASEIHTVAAGGASVLQLVKDTSTNAPGAGSDLLTNNTNTGFDLNGTANTVQTGTLTATVATKTLAAGDRLSVDYANTIQSTAGVVVTACMAPQ